MSHWIRGRSSAQVRSARAFIRFGMRKEPVDDYEVYRLLSALDRWKLGIDQARLVRVPIRERKRCGNWRSQPERTDLERLAYAFAVQWRGAHCVAHYYLVPLDRPTGEQHLDPPFPGEVRGARARRPERTAAPEG